MNILLSAGMLGKKPFANNNIEILLADTLCQMGHSCAVMGVSYDEGVNYTTKWGTKVYSFGINKIYTQGAKALEDYLLLAKSESEKTKLVKKFILRHPLWSFAIFLLQKDIPYRRLKKQYKKYIAKKVKAEKTDIVLGFCYPFDMAETVLSQNLPCTKIYYQFDPYGMHQTIETDRAQGRKKEETDLISMVNHTLTTRALYSQYAADSEYSKYIDKITPVDFPVLIQKKAEENCPLPFDMKKENINILFCGTMDDGFRNPEYLFQNFKPVLDKKESNIRLYFLGPQQGVIVSNWAEKYPDKIFFYPAVENKIAVAVTEKADILLNIGNSISNMVPSKIIDCFATGKPIINVQKIEDCPSAQYFEKYPLVLTLKEFCGEMLTENLEEFIMENYKNRIDFDTVEKLYRTATPKYAAQLILDIADRSKNG